MIRPDLIQHAAVGGLVAGAALLIPGPLEARVGAGLVLAVLAACAREAYSLATGRGTADPADLAATVGGALLVALVALTVI